MTRFIRSLALCALLCISSTVFLVPTASAEENRKPGTPYFVSKPVPLGNDYALTVTGSGKTLFVDISKEDDIALQSYHWLFTNLETNTVKSTAPDLATASFTASLDAPEVGAQGTISMKSNRSSITTGKVAGCQGVIWQKRQGTFKGSFEFDTNTEMFGVIKLNELKIASLRRPLGPSRCTNPWPCPTTKVLGISYEEGLTFITRTEGVTSASGYKRTFFAAGGFYSQYAEQHVPAADLTFAPDLSSASAELTGLIEGSIQYTADGPEEARNEANCGAWSQSFGTITGDLVFNFDIGTFSPTPNYGYVNDWP